MIGRLASACAGRGHWEALTTLLDGAALPSLGAAPGLLATAAEAGQYALAARIVRMVRSCCTHGHKELSLADQWLSLPCTIVRDHV